MLIRLSFHNISPTFWVKNIIIIAFMSHYLRITLFSPIHPKRLF